jgi:ribosomal protein S18 acetylase RimI-like enzyme
MKGQRLFIRPVEAGDAPAIAEFLSSHAPDSSVPACGLLAKLVGDLVAVIALDLDGDDSVTITDIVVAPAFRRKRIGRAIVEEAVQLARKLERKALVAPVSGAPGFFRRIGFEDSGSNLVRRV